MNVRELERDLARAAGVTVGEVDQRMRPLRESGVLPMGGRGPHAPEIDESHAAMMILQMVSRRAVDANDVGLVASTLTLIAPPDLPDPFGGPTPAQGINLPSALIFLLQNHDFAWKWLQVQADGKAAWLTVFRADVPLDLVFSAPGSEPMTDRRKYALQGNGSCGSRFAIGAGVVKGIGWKLTHPTKSGWVGEGD